MAQSIGLETTLSFGDNALISSHLEGNEYAFQVLVERYQDKLVNYIYNLVGDYEQAVDLGQETFIRVFKHAHRYHAKYQFSTWIYRIATNLALDEIRRRKRRSRSFTYRLFFQQEEQDIPLEHDGPSPECSLDRKEQIQLLQTALKSLPEKYRLVFVLREVQELSHEEVGKVLKLSVGTVKSRLHRAKKLLRQKLARVR
jgi:RNA polymerase sigma-70 factor (ECF subfamily)